MCTQLQVCEIDLGFKKNEIQHIVLAVPKVLTANKKKLTQIFDLLHNTMNVPHHLIVKFPQVNCAAMHEYCIFIDLFIVFCLFWYLGRQ